MVLTEERTKLQTAQAKAEQRRIEAEKEARAAEEEYKRIETQLTELDSRLREFIVLPSAPKKVKKEQPRVTKLRPAEKKKRAMKAKVLLEERLLKTFQAKYGSKPLKPLVDTIFTEHAGQFMTVTEVTREVLKRLSIESDPIMLPVAKKKVGDCMSRMSRFDPNIVRGDRGTYMLRQVGESPGQV